ncbi:MAG: DUF4962 domain-containing protein [Planctomycetes bacterium]|nr:DUF4962 domain-containing protein [Planctomycetota bacterium]
MRYVAQAIGVAFLLLAAAVSPCRAVVAKQPPLGTFQMRPELVGQHPRLFFTAADIPLLQQRANGEAKFFVDAARSDYAGYRGQAYPTPFPTDWKQFLYGDWALVTFDMLAVARNDTTARNTAKNWALGLAADRWWVKDDLAPMDALSGLSMTYDVLYHHFTEAQRAQLRAAIWDGMTYIRGRTFVDQYWTHDYQNNHAHNRINAMAMAAFAIYGDDPAYNVQPYADLAIQQIRNVLEWAPDDGSQHEGPGYWLFGHHWVVRMVHLAEHVTGENLVGQYPHMTNAHLFRLYMTTPGWNDTFNIGDGGGGAPNNVTAMVRGIADAQDPWSTTVLRNWMQHEPDRFYQHTIWGLLWYDGTLAARPVEELPLGRFWGDLEMVSVRSGWTTDDVGFVFKCGPVGGHKMQQLRGSSYINVAHDDADQNHFLIYAFGKMLAADDGYPDINYTSSHNTLLIDGLGQPRDGSTWQQPFDYSLTGRMRDVCLGGNTFFGTGDASPCYERASRFWRHAAFVDGRYVVLLDDLIGTGTANRQFQWRLHNTGTWTTQGANKYRVTESGGVWLDIEFLNDGAMTSQFFAATDHAQQGLAVTQTGHTAKFLSVLVPRRTGLAPLTAQKPQTYNATAVQVDGDGKRDIIAVRTDTSGAIPLFGAGTLAGRAVAAIVTYAGSQVESLMMVRGDWLLNDGVALVSTNADVNLSRRNEDDSVIVEIAPPYKAAPLGVVQLRLGGFSAGAGYVVAVDGVRMGTMTADGAGELLLPVEVDELRTITIEVPNLVANAGPDQTVTDTDGDGFETVTLDGSASFARTGEITGWFWFLDDVMAGMGQTLVKALPVGENVITLAVTNMYGEQATDTVTVTVEPGAAVPGDCDGDGDVDLDDFVVLKNNFGRTGDATRADGDFDGDRDVDLDDFVILKSNFGT